MKNTRKTITAAFLAILLLAIAAPLTMKSAQAEETETPVNLHSDEHWTYINNSVITILFPAGGKKPMFLWWYTNDPSNIYVVKFKGLIEYYTYNASYFMWRSQADGHGMGEYMRQHFYQPMHGMMGEIERYRIEDDLNEIENADAMPALGLHAPYLPFSGSTWELAGPVNVTRGDVKYLSFNFTLVDVHGKPNFQFADGNVMLRARFYYTPATEDAYGQYSYSVAAGELKIDLVINKWEWNVDKLQPMINGLRQNGLSIPESKPSLALWVNLASVNTTKAAEEDEEIPGDTGFTEHGSMAQNMYVEGDKFSVAENETGHTDEMPMQNRMRERFQFRFETGNATTFAGFFKFVPQAIITNGVTYNVTDVTASYISAGAHVRLFIGYPYFGNNSLIHDPSIGLEAVVPWLPTSLLMILVGVTIVIAVAVAAVKLRKKPVNIVRVQ